MSDCCRSCGSVDLNETVMPEGYVHYSRIDCKDCGKFVKWGKKPVVQVIHEMYKNTGGNCMNSVNLIGRLTKDVEMRYTSNNNTAVAGFTLAVNRRFKQENQPDADFINIVAWQKTAEFCGKYFKKGLQVFVVGKIQTRSWDDTEGKKHYVTEVVADEVGFADSKKDDNGSGQNNPPAQQQQQQTPPAGNQQQNNTCTPPANPPPAGAGAPPWTGAGTQQAGAPPAKMPWEV